jgi:hypothetical protein
VEERIAALSNADAYKPASKPRDGSKSRSQLDEISQHGRSHQSLDEALICGTDPGALLNSRRE